MALIAGDIHINLHTKENRTALTKMVMRLFDLWEIPVEDQAVLLNRSPSTIRRYRKGGCFADGEDMLDRVGYLLSIHKSLKTLYPYNEDVVYRWVAARNQAFDGKTPIEVMKKGLESIIAVRVHLEHRLLI